MTEHTPSRRFHFPVEGKSRWVPILRVMALGNLGAVAAVGLSIGVSAGGASGESLLVIAGIAAVLLLEYLVVLKVVVPRAADYGRYRIYENKVDFYPLSPLGFGIGARSESVPTSAFCGIAIRPDVFGVYLVSAAPGRTLPLQQCRSMDEARHEALDLADRMGLTVIPWQ